MADLRNSENEQSGKHEKGRSADGRLNKATGDFWERYDRLPESIRRLADKAYRFFLEQPTSPAFHAHELRDNRRGKHKPGSISIRVTQRYRAVYHRVGDTNVWYWIGSHSDYNQFTGEK